jgi:hypothetical protein
MTKMDKIGNYMLDLFGIVLLVLAAALLTTLCVAACIMIGRAL